jgi:integrase
MSNDDLTLFPKPKSGYFEAFLSKGYKGRYDIYYYNFENGKRSKKTTKTNRQTEARKKLDEFNRTYLNNQKDTKIRVLSDFKDILLEIIKNNISKKTVEIHVNSIKKLIRVVGNKEIRLVTFWDIEQFKAHYSRIINKTSVNIYLRSLKRLFNISVKIGAIEQNPLKGIQQFSIPQTERLCFEDIEIEKLLSTIDKPVLKQILIFALLTGCRIGEILNLTWEDIDFERKVIHIRNKPDFLTKTRREREIPMYNELYQFLINMFNIKPQKMELWNQ